MLRRDRLVRRRRAGGPSRGQLRRQPAALRNRLKGFPADLQPDRRRRPRVGAIYHSHTRSAAYPSQTDINLALWPDALYIIVSLAEADAPDVKAFAIVDRKVNEVELDVSDS